VSEPASQDEPSAEPTAEELAEAPAEPTVEEPSSELPAPSEQGPPWLIFLLEAYAPGMHLGFVAVWFLGLAGALHLVRGVPWRLDLSVLLSIVALFFLMYFIRIVDEVKDADYDLQFNPDRPFARGAVTLADLRRYALVTGLLTLACGAWPSIRVSVFLLPILAVDLFHTLLLVKLEQRSELVSEHMLVNLVVTYPVNLLVTVYTYVYVLGVTGGEPRFEDALLVGAFALFFLHFELGRKLVWPKVLEPNEKAYTLVIPPVLGAIGVVVLSAGSTAAVLVALAPWASERPFAWVAWGLLAAPLLALVMAGRFLGRRDQRVKLKGLGMLGITLFYGVLTLASLLGNQLRWAV
jgi:hypothetical protein